MELMNASHLFMKVSKKEPIIVIANLRKNNENFDLFRQSLFIFFKVSLSRVIPLFCNKSEKGPFLKQETTIYEQ
ncbi:hypothetical protein SAMN05660841_01955 [Sphingobacterium nematocida]|uniref:Uncharacterized protein n=1 Tax=Sphingobacterium nematocida TaxID=1513896 RepID=A0A1T5DGM2_9SPHI|nr:hypothetical protein SAMN05660841_01955 [Sphingobacterium nematocida]